MPKLKDFTIAEARPLPVIILADISGSMAVDGKIQALNLAIRDMIAVFQEEAELRAEIHLAMITFGGKANVALELQPVNQVLWTDFDPIGGTPLGGAIDLAREMIEDREILSTRSYRPTVVLVSDGQPTDDWKPSLDHFFAGDRTSKSFRMALSIGADADKDVLAAYLNDANGRVFHAEEARQIRQFFELVSMSVSARSRSANPNVLLDDMPSDGWDL